VCEIYKRWIVCCVVCLLYVHVRQHGRSEQQLGRDEDHNKRGTLEALICHLKTVTEQVVEYSPL
jgi:hypothetical protein